jgi:hypothetical protein
MTRIRFEDLPSTNTPRNAENLNKLNNVLISSAEPTTGEEVWLQKGKNLFDYKNAEYFNAYLDATKGTWEPFSTDNVYKTTYIKVAPNTTYTISKKAGKAFRIATFTNLPKVGDTFNTTYENHSGTKITFTTGENDNYIVILCFSTVNGDTGVYLDMYSSVQLEQGETATSYEPYIDKKIYTKNGNGGYEEFYNAEPIIKSLSLGSFTTDTGYTPIKLNSSNAAILGFKYTRGGQEGPLKIEKVTDNAGNWFIRTLVDGTVKSCVLNNVFVYYIN